MPRPGFWWIYVLERADGSWYTGISTDPRRRLQQHIAGTGARANKISAPRRLLSLEGGGAYPQALRREAQIKKLAKAAKRAYVADPGSLAWPGEKAPWLNGKKRPKKKRSKKRARIIGKDQQGKAVKV